MQPGTQCIDPKRSSCLWHGLVVRCLHCFPMLITPSEHMAVMGQQLAGMSQQLAGMSQQLAGMSQCWLDEPAADEW